MSEMAGERRRLSAAADSRHAVQNGDEARRADRYIEHEADRECTLSTAAISPLRRPTARPVWVWWCCELSAWVFTFQAALLFTCQWTKGVHQCRRRVSLTLMFQRRGELLCRTFRTPLESRQASGKENSRD